MKQKITEILLSLGIHRTLLGFHYLRYSLSLCYENEDYLLCCTSLFEAAAKQFDTTFDNVDHCIRTAVRNCWYNGNRELLKEIAGYPLKEVPTNGEFIDILYRHLEKITY